MIDAPGRAEVQLHPILGSNQRSGRHPLVVVQTANEWAALIHRGENRRYGRQAPAKPGIEGVWVFEHMGVMIENR